MYVKQAEIYRPANFRTDNIADTDSNAGKEITYDLQNLLFSIVSRASLKSQHFNELICLFCVACFMCCSSPVALNALMSIK